MRPINAIALALGAAFIIGQAYAQQPPPDPTAQLSREWSALALQQSHAEEAINRLILSYEARLSTAMEWLKHAQDAAAPAAVAK